MDKFMAKLPAMPAMTTTNMIIAGTIGTVAIVGTGVAIYVATKKKDEASTPPPTDIPPTDTPDTDDNTGTGADAEDNTASDTDGPSAEDLAAAEAAAAAEEAKKAAGGGSDSNTGTGTETPPPPPPPPAVDKCTKCDSLTTNTDCVSCKTCDWYNAKCMTIEARKAAVDATCAANCGTFLTKDSCGACPTTKCVWYDSKYNTTRQSSCVTPAKLTEYQAADTTQASLDKCATCGSLTTAGTCGECTSCKWYMGGYSSSAAKCFTTVAHAAALVVDKAYEERCTTCSSITETDCKTCPSCIWFTYFVRDRWNKFGCVTKTENDVLIPIRDEYIKQSDGYAALIPAGWNKDSPSMITWLATNATAVNAAIIWCSDTMVKIAAARTKLGVKGTIDPAKGFFYWANEVVKFRYNTLLTAKTQAEAAKKAVEDAAAKVIADDDAATRAKFWSYLTPIYPLSTHINSQSTIVQIGAKQPIPNEYWTYGPSLGYGIKSENAVDMATLLGYSGFAVLGVISPVSRYCFGNCSAPIHETNAQWYPTTPDVSSKGTAQPSQSFALFKQTIDLSGKILKTSRGVFITISPKGTFIPYNTVYTQKISTGSILGITALSEGIALTIAGKAIQESVTSETYYQPTNRAFERMSRPSYR
jgi:hypothetical protein